MFDTTKNTKIKSFEESRSLELQDSNLKVNKRANYLTTAFMKILKRKEVNKPYENQ